jgi:hypothetical protein
VRAPTCAMILPPAYRRDAAKGCQSSSVHSLVNPGLSMMNHGK